MKTNQPTYEDRLAMRARQFADALGISGADALAEYGEEANRQADANEFTRGDFAGALLALDGGAA